MAMDPKTFERLCRIVYDRSGITLGESKEALLAARLGKRVRTLGLSGFEDYLRYLCDDETGEEIVQLLDAISTNVTSFFRESEHFDFLKEVLSRWIEEGRERLRFWSAACSTGEEPYTLAMTVLEALGTRPRDLRILATDISTRVLEKSKRGVYEKEKAETIPPALRERYLERIRENGNVLYRVKEPLRKVVVFARLNLSVTPFVLRGPFDAIFCRNVMIYFDETIRKRLLREMHRLLSPGGLLFVGHAESLAALGTDFQPIRPSIYRRVLERAYEEARP
jgi:chemotaxis protein methyltransferase CheR